MSIRFAAAQAVSSISTWGLKHVFRRPAANFPGKIALYVDPRLLANLRGKLTRGSIMVVGTNGKTTVTNLLADVLEGSGVRVVCNRTGANLDSGVSTALLHAKEADWGVFESDELWLKKMTPQLKPTYVLLLNLFRDQLDRCGEIDRIQDSIVEALAASPETILVFNADDPLCATIAKRASELPGRERTRQIAFGVSESMGLAQNTVSDATMCQLCSSMFEYDFRQYGQLGAWHCPTCGFSRPSLDFAAQNVELGERELSFDIARPQPNAGESAPARPIRAAFSGAYMVYNLLAVGVAADLVGCGNDAIQAAIESFDPKNGRLQRYSVEGRSILLNLAKNPTGFNQNLKIIEKDASPKAVAFFINDKEADGRDISWLWDIDFEELSRQEGCVVFAGGIRGNDMQVRLKYAGIPSKVVKNTQEFLDELAKLPHEMNAYAIANYTALPNVKSALDAAESEAGDPTNCEAGDPVRETPCSNSPRFAAELRAEHAVPAQKLQASSSIDAHRTPMSQVEGTLPMRQFSYRGREYATRLLGSYQPSNAAMAIEIAGALRERGWEIPDEAIARGIAETRWPARFEVLDQPAGMPTVVIDGGHNPQGAGVLADSLRDVFPDKRPVFLVGILADKDYRSMLRAVAPLASAFVCVTPPNPRALDAADLAETIRETCGELGARATIEVAGDFDDAASAARKIAGPEGLICAFGSLYSIADVKAAFLRAADSNSLQL